MATSENGVPARLKDLKESVKERFLGLLGLNRQKGLEAEVIEEEQEVFLQVGRQTWHAPRQLRVELWLSSLARRHTLVNEYPAYLERDITREAAVDIEKDVQRTFPSTRRFRAEEGQAQLRNVLRAYAAYDPEVAYCQGMNFLTGLLLMYMPTEGHAFAALVVLMEDRKLKNFYHRSMSLLQVQLWQLSRLISPALNRHLEALGVVPMLYGASWLMTAFSADFPLSFSARVMDVLLAEQCECPLLKVATFLMKAAAPKLLQMMDLEEVLGYLKIEIPSLDELELHDVLQAAFNKPWTKRQLEILRSTEGAETVAQAMDRVLSMIEQPGDDDDDGDVADARVAVTVPRLNPPPRCPNSAAASFVASPACATPIGGGPLGTGSIGGAGTSPPAGLTSPKRPSFDGRSTIGGGDGELLQQEGGAAAASPAVWGIPGMHPNAQASPAIQAFRRAHLPCLVAGAAPTMRSARSILASSSSLVEATVVDAAAGQPRLLTCVSEEWGDFSSPAALQHLHWRSLSRSMPGSARQQQHNGEERLSAGVGSTGAAGCSSAAASMGGCPTQDAQLSPNGCPTLPIPVPLPGNCAANRGMGGSAFAAAATAPAQPASGRPPLPPRYASFDRAAGPCSRLSVVAEDPLAVQMGPAAPAPSPRGSMDMYVLGRTGSQQLEGCGYGLLLSGGTSFGGGCDAPGCAVAGGVGSASCNGDCASGTASATTGGAFLSPSGVSGAVSPHAVSPRILSGWHAAAGVALGAGGGSDTPTIGYVPLGLVAMERATSETLLDHVPALHPPDVFENDHSALPTEQKPQPPEEAQKDMAADIAGDILRMLTAVDTGSAVNVNNARAVMHEAMYADSPHKEQSPDEKPFAKEGENSLHQLPSSSSLAEMAAQDLAKAQEEAERLRQEMEAQLQQRRAAERGAGTAPESSGGVAAMEGADGELPVQVPPLAAPLAEAADPAEGGVTAAESVIGDGTATAEAPAAFAIAAAPSEEFVLRRPTLYVDGIPMFDPRGIMADAQEAKVMFTPAVSPGATSYAEPLPAVVTPTSVTQAAESTAIAGAETEQAEGAGPEASADAPSGFMSDAVEATEPEMTSPVPAEPHGEAGARLEHAAAPSPAPSEWVDWSQAPPIQATQALAADAVPGADNACADTGAPREQSADLIDVASPAHQAESAPPPDCGATVGSGPSHAPAPVCPWPHAPNGSNTQPALTVVDSVHVDPASARQFPYGLLPAASTMQVGAPPLPHSLSFAGSAAGSVQTAMHGGPVDLQRSTWTQLRSESFAAGDICSRAGSHRWGGCGFSSDTDGEGTPRAGDVGVGHPMLPQGPLPLHGSHHRPSNLSQSGTAPASCSALNGAVQPTHKVPCGVADSVEEEAEDPASPARPAQEVPGASGPAPASATFAAGPTEGPPLNAAAVEVLAPDELFTASQGGASISAEALPQLLAAGLDQRMSEAEMEAEAGAVTPVGHQGSCEVEGEAEDGDTSPYRAALSPSLAHHIMSAYLRSEQHEQQQQQRELEERLQQQQQDSVTVATSLATGASSTNHAAADDTAVMVEGQGLAVAPNAATGHNDVRVVAELSLCSLPTAATPTATPSGLSSPFMASPNRIPSVPAAPSAAASTMVAVAAGQHAKALTPFAVAMDDPSMCRLSAELLQALPPPPLLLQPETPAPPVPAPSSGSGLVVPANALLCCGGSGDAERDAALAAVGAGRLVACGGMHSITLGQLAAAPAGSHQLLRGTVSQDASNACASGAAALHAPGARPAMASNGGAVPPLLPPLLPPPPAPQVPLCQTSVRPEAPAPLQAHIAAEPAVPMPSQPVQCITAADVMCVHGAADAASAVSSATAASHSVPPSWTATFDDAPSNTSGVCSAADALSGACPAQLPTRGSAGAASSGIQTPGAGAFGLVRGMSVEAP